MWRARLGRVPRAPPGKAGVVKGSTWNISTAGLPALRWPPADIVEVGPRRLVVNFSFFNKTVYYVEKRKYAIGAYILHAP